MSAVQFTPNQFKNKAWRLNNLYYVVNKDGKRVKFQFNRMQADLHQNLHSNNILLKARQLGASTYVSLFQLDECVFRSNFRAGTVAQDLPSAKGLFRDKIKYPYENLPEQLRNIRAPLNDNSDELLLSNNSSLRVATSMRSSTLNSLHVSEFGKICAHFPERAREIITGSLNTLAAGAMSFIESTAEGKEGRFYEMCAMAQTKQRLGADLRPTDYRFHFFPWMSDPSYVAEPFDIPQNFVAYFDKLEEMHGIVLRPEQKSWYVDKASTQFDDMKREYPSTPEEAFEASIEGCYYGPQIAAAEMSGRIGKFEPDPRYAVNSAWDIGYGDASAIWFFQYIAHTSRLRFLRYYENSGEGAEHYVRKLRQLAKEYRWPAYGSHFLPHDVRVTEWGTGKTRVEQLIELGIRPKLVPQAEVDDGINAVRMSFGKFEFDEGGCAEGLKALRAYRKEWDEDRGCWKDRPRHDWASHGSDALRYCSMAWREGMKTLLKDVVPPAKDERIQVLTPADQETQRGVTLNDLWDDHRKRQRQRRRL